jgi:hypothetical protein
MSRLARMYRGQLRAIEEALDSWQTDHAEAMGVHDLEETVLLCLELDRRIRKQVIEVWEGAFGGAAIQSEKVGRVFRESLQVAVEVWKTLEAMVEECVRHGYHFEGADQVKEAQQRAIRLEADQAAHWPFVRLEDIDRGAAEIEAGKFITGEDWLRELHSQGS